VIAWMPGAAVYFRDPDGHQLEYLAMLDEEPDLEAGILPWSQWRAGASQ
jgi:lactoylglutathione lyase